MNDQTTASKPKRTGPKWLKDARKPRPDEVIGGGFFVFRRGKHTKRIKASWFPFEHGSLAAAEAQARKLAEKNPGEEFVVVSQVFATPSSLTGGEGDG